MVCWKHSLSLIFEKATKLHVLNTPHDKTFESLKAESSLSLMVPATTEVKLSVQAQKITQQRKCWRATSAAENSWNSNRKLVQYVLLRTKSTVERSRKMFAEQRLERVRSPKAHSVGNNQDDSSIFDDAISHSFLSRQTYRQSFSATLLPTAPSSKLSQ